MVKAAQILDLLAQKHSGDVFVPECKDGPTHYASHRRLDAWAMNRSWANACVTGYEIKVNRSDFLNDLKWLDYLPLCNCLYFVCPSKLIQPAELPPEAGLMWVATTGTRLFTKKKAPHRQVEIPDGVWRYILMCRARITREHRNEGDTIEYWKRWLERKREEQGIGHRVSRRLCENHARLEAETIKLRALVNSYETMRARLTELGFDPDVPVHQWSFRDRMRELQGELPKGFHYAIDRAISGLEKVREIVGNGQ